MRGPYRTPAQIIERPSKYIWRVEGEPGYHHGMGDHWIERWTTLGYFRWRWVALLWAYLYVKRYPFGFVSVFKDYRERTGQ